MNVDLDHLARLRQVHGTSVAVVREADAPGGLPEADIILTSDMNHAIAIQTADCVPILIADQRSGAVAAAHAGWRGLAARAPETAVQALVRESGGRPSDFIVAVGPAIAACCYEVGGDVRRRFEAAGFTPRDIARWFLADRPIDPGNPPLSGLPLHAREGHAYFDAPGSARDQLIAAGVAPHDIHMAGLCTASHPDRLCSYRREGQAAGRMAAAIRSRRPDPSRRSPDDPRGR